MGADWENALTRFIVRPRHHNILSAIFISFFGAGLVWETKHLTGHYLSAPVICAVLLIGLTSSAVVALTAGVALSLFTDYFFIPPVGTVLSSLEGFEHLFILIGLTLFANSVAFAIKRLLGRIEKSKTLIVSELNDAIAIRDDFIAVASHELKAPLAAINLSLQMLVRRLSLENLTPEIPRIQRQISAMQNLLSDFLDVARIQTGQFGMDLRETEMNSLIREVIERFAPELREAKLQLQLNLEDQIVGNWDQARIDQVLSNLISNVIKYAPNGRVTISTQLRSGRAILSIQDSGKGIRKDMHARIFDRYERGEVSSNVSGFGLGLYIVKQIITQHNGSIRLESDIGMGANFIVELPAVPPVWISGPHA